MAYFESLDQIEQELQELMHTEVRTWQRTAQLLIQVREGHLYTQKASSFTQWVRLTAQQFKIHESNFWRILKAGEYYLSMINSEDLALIDEAKATPEQLELVRKISRYAPNEVEKQLVEKAILGDLVLADLRRTWQTYRPVAEGQTARGWTGANKISNDASLEDENERIFISTDEPRLEFETLNRLSSSQREKLTAANFLEAMRREKNKRWLEWIEPLEIPDHIDTIGYSDVFTEVAVRSGMSQSARRMDAVILLKIESFPFPLVIGIEIKVSLHDLRDDKKLTEYLPFCDYFFIGIPDDEAMRQEAVSILVPQIGILSLDAYLNITLLKEGSRLKPVKVGETFGALLKQGIRWVNLPYGQF